MPKPLASAAGTGMTATVASASRSTWKREHLADVHLVDVVGAEDADVRRALVLDHVEVLEHGVGAALEEARARGSSAAGTGAT